MCLRQDYFQMSQVCSCAGRIAAAEHDIERYRQERDEALQEAGIQKLIAAKAQNKWQRALSRLGGLPRVEGCWTCAGTGLVSGNGSAATPSRGAHPGYGGAKRLG